MAAVDLIEQKLVDFAGAADEVWIDLLIGTALYPPARPAGVRGRPGGEHGPGRRVGAAVADPAMAGPSGRFGTHLGQILVLGPPEGGGTLKDVQEANASLQLALSALVSGASQRQREALRPGANRTVNGRRPDAVFAGIGVLEVIFDPARAARMGGPAHPGHHAASP